MGSALRPKWIAGETTIDVDIDAYIPDFFIESDSERLDFYRRLYTASTEDEIRGMRDELRDRFGEYPEEVENLFAIVQLKTIASKLGFSKVELTRNQLSLFFPPPEEKTFYESADGTTPPFQAMMALLPGLRQFKAHLKQDGKQLKLLAALREGDAAKVVLASAKEFLVLLGGPSVTMM